MTPLSRRRRGAVRLAAGATGLVIAAGSIAYSSVGQAGHAPGVPGRPATTAPAPRPATPATAPFSDESLVYASDTLSSPQVDAIARAAGTLVTVIYRREINLLHRVSGYPVIPVSAMSADPIRYAHVAGVPALADAFAGGAVVTATEARIRHAAVGDTVRLATNRRLTVTAIVDDATLGGAEMFLPAALLRLRGLGAAYVLVPNQGHPAEVATRIRHAIPDTAVRIRTQTGNGYLSDADSVLTQLQVKQRFGEFALRPAAHAGIIVDPHWIDANLVTRRVPQLGVTTCHRKVMPALVAAMTEITNRHLDALVHSANFAAEGGCWHPNIVPGPARLVSRHTWGIAVDLNVDANPFGARPRQDRRLVTIMAKHGFAWGGDWLQPDAMHFEYVRG